MPLIDFVKQACPVKNHALCDASVISPRRDSVNPPFLLLVRPKPCLQFCVTNDERLRKNFSCARGAADWLRRPARQFAEIYWTFCEASANAISLRGSKRGHAAFL